MPRQTISLSEPNHSWLQARIESGEFRTQTEAVNDALRRVRELESGVEELRARLIRSERGGFTDQSAEEILEASKSQLRSNGEL